MLVVVPLIPAAILVVLIAVYYVTRTSTSLPATVTFAKPTTVIPAGTAILAGLVVVGIVVVFARSDLSPLVLLGLALVLGFVVLTAGGTTSGNRVVYDRGGIRLSPGKLIGVAMVAVVCFMGLIQQQ